MKKHLASKLFEIWHQTGHVTYEMFFFVQRWTLKLKVKTNGP